MKQLLIAEKPDQARSFYLPMLEKISGEKFEKRNGHFESHSYYLSWFFGHLLEQIKPDEYDEKYKNWRMEDLPIIPEKMVYKYKGESQKAQGLTIFELCKKSDEIICGTDPDREGQGIYETFVKYHDIQKPMKRLWATSLTEKDLGKAWNKRKDIKEYRHLSEARALRADSDWLVGMNASRAYSIIAKGNLPVGRVLTATLAIIVKRDLEVENHKESFFYQLKGKWAGIEFCYFTENGQKFDDRAFVEKIKTTCDKSQFSLSGFRQELKIENPPKTFNLPDLQKEAFRKFGFSLNKTLELAQALYEKRMTTYPRTDSPYLPESDLTEYHDLVIRIATPDEAKLLRPVGERPPCVKNSDSPHTALIVTGENAPLSNDEAKLYELIRSRFVCAFMTPRQYEQFDLEIEETTGKKFRAIVKRDVEPGFRRLYKEDDEKEEEIQTSSERIDEHALKERKELINGMEVIQSKKAKPKYYTPATLITAMQTCGRLLENEEARKILAETKGIGTPATQAIYPQQLSKYEYITDQKGCFISTAKGRKIIAGISPDLKTPELTADWEMKLKMIENGKLAPEIYRKELTQYVEKIVEDAKQRQGKIDLTSGVKINIPCPQCSKEISKMPWGYACVSKDCGFTISMKISEKNIPEKEIEKLLKTGECGVIKGFKKKDKSGTFDAKLVLKEENGKKRAVFAFDNTPCPKCKKGSIRFFEWGAACSERETCGFKVSGEIAKRKISEANIKKLISKGSTDLIKGFISPKSGKKFDAKLIFGPENALKFDFGR